MRQVIACVILTLASNVIATVPQWGQCGGIDYTGDTTCASGLTCVVINSFYSQCLLATTTQGTTPTSSTTGTLSATPSSSVLPSCPCTNPDSLTCRFRSKGKVYFGISNDYSGLSSAPSLNIFKSQFNEVTPLTAMTWTVVEPTQNSFNFAQGDSIVNWAQTNCFLVRGFTFIWSSQLPSWVSSITTAPALTSAIQNHITKEASHWAGKIYAWDVCNEILNDDGSLRSSVFYNILGDTFVSIAFKAARAADPNAKLYINDYNLDSATSTKTVSMISHVKAWKAAGVPIDGIGSECHLAAGGAAGVQGALTALAGSGVSQVAITQLDIAGGAANDFVTVVKACLAVSACVGITISTLTGLYDSNFQPTTAYTAVLAALA